MCTVFSFFFEASVTSNKVHLVRDYNRHDSTKSSFVLWVQHASVISEITGGEFEPANPSSYYSESSLHFISCF